MGQKLFGIAVILGSIFLGFIAYGAQSGDRFAIDLILTPASMLRLSTGTAIYATSFLSLTLLLWGLYILLTNRR